MARKAQVEGEVSAVKAKPAALAIENALEKARSAFIKQFPDKWEELRLTPLQHGLDAMIEALADG